MTPQDLDQIARLLAYPIGGGILLNQLDDLFIDANYVARGLHRRGTCEVSLEELRDCEQKRIAILLPAWQEADVIEQMLEHNLAAIDYDRSRYEIFCGTYANDPRTQAPVDALAARVSNVHKVVVPHDGPTCKADCLNWVYQGVVLEEQRRGMRFEILLMHDAEDVIHPLALRLYSMLIPRYEFVQTPVFSLDLAPSEMVAGTYIDEFSEHHLKEMRVRESIGGLIPSAGVGSAFDRAAFEAIALASRQKPFNDASLTEDYEIGLRFRLANRRVHFACCTVLRKQTAGGGRPARVRDEYIATREFFPSDFGASVRQRSRWVLGIALQTWEQIGWQGALPVLYCLWRDRKALFTNALLVLSYALVGYIGLRFSLGLASGSHWDPSELIPPRTFLYTLMSVNLMGFVARCAVKMYFVRRLYGLWHGLLSPARLLVANVISIAATARAVRTYVRHLVTKQPLRWVKTAHAFPSAAALAAESTEPLTLVAVAAAQERRAS